MGDQVDYCVIGGGIQGVFIARALAQAGRDVCLLEADDLGYRTSSRSSKLAHGGLRYMPQGQLGLVAECLREREWLNQTYPHFCQRLNFHIPVSGSPIPSKLMMHLGLSFYGLMAGRFPGYQSLSRDEVQARHPDLDVPDDHYFSYEDVSLDDVRLTIQSACDAAQHGAQIRTGHRVVSFNAEGVDGVELAVESSADNYQLKAGTVINCAGPYAITLFPQRLSGLCFSRGSHLLVSGLESSDVYVRPIPGTGRIQFLIPHIGGHLFGTTDQATSDLNNQERVVDRATLTEDLQSMLKHSRYEVLSFFSGLRVLWGQGTSTARLPRKTVIHQNPHRVWHVLGGKLTSARATAFKVLKKLGVKALEKGSLATGADPSSLLNDLDRLIDQKGGDAKLAPMLAQRYGHQAKALVDEALAQELACLDKRPLCMAELRWSCQHEFFNLPQGVISRFGLWRFIKGDWQQTKVALQALFPSFTLDALQTVIDRELTEWT